MTREGGSHGEVESRWNVSDPDNDLIETAGALDWAAGQLEAELELKVRGDATPELDETFFVRLTFVSLVSERCAKCSDLPSDM